MTTQLSHRELTRLGVPSHKDSNKLGRRKRNIIEALRRMAFSECFDAACDRNPAGLDALIADLGL